MQYNKVEILGNCLDILSDNYKTILDVLRERESGELQSFFGNAPLCKLLGPQLDKNQDLIKKIIEDLQTLDYEYIAPFPEGISDYDDDDDEDFPKEMEVSLNPSD